MKLFKKIPALLFVILMITAQTTTVFAAEYSANDIDKKINALLNYEYRYTNTGSLNKFVSDYLSVNAGTSTCDWYIIALGRYGSDFDKSLYINNLNRKLTEIYNNGVKNEKITDLQRMALAYTACSANIQNIAGHNLLADCTYNRELSELSSQGIITLDYALIVLDSQNSGIPQNAVTTRDDIVAEILSLQLENGGFSLDGKYPDADVTAMTITALAPYVKNNNTVSNAVDKAVDKLSKMQKADGKFASYGNKNCESTAQVVVALTSLGIDPATDSRFIKNGVSPLDAMFSFQLSSGGFSHNENGKEDQMATYQAFYSAVAYKSFLISKQSLYNFSNKDNPQQNVTVPSSISEKSTLSHRYEIVNSENSRNNNQADNENQNNVNNYNCENQSSSSVSNIQNTEENTSASSESSVYSHNNQTISTADETRISSENSQINSTESKGENKISLSTSEFLSAICCAIVLSALYIYLFIVKSKIKSKQKEE